MAEAERPTPSPKLQKAVLGRLREVNIPLPFYMLAGGDPALGLGETADTLLYLEETGKVRMTMEPDHEGLFRRRVVGHTAVFAAEPVTDEGPEEGAVDGSVLGWLGNKADRANSVFRAVQEFARECTVADAMWIGGTAIGLVGIVESIVAPSGAAFGITEAAGVVGAVGFAKEVLFSGTPQNGHTSA